MMAKGHGEHHLSVAGFVQEVYFFSKRYGFFRFQNGYKKLEMAKIHQKMGTFKIWELFSQP